MKVSHEEGLKTENAILSKHSSFLNGNLQINVFLSVLYSIKCCVRLSISLVLVQLVASASSQPFSLYFLLCLLTSFTT